MELEIMQLEIWCSGLDGPTWKSAAPSLEK